MAEIANRAAAAHEALAALAQAVKKLPPPTFKFDRSLVLLEQLGSWANTSQKDVGFGNAEVLSTALEAGLKAGSASRNTEPVQSPETAKESLTAQPAELTPPVPRSLSETAAILGRKGGESRSDEKVAASRASMRAINKRRWGKKRKKRAKGRQVRRRS